METGNKERGTGHWSLVTQENGEQRTKNVELNSLDRPLSIFFPHQSINPYTRLPLNTSTSPPTAIITNV